MEPIKEAGCVIVHPDGIILRLTADGHWVFPKGHIEANETPAQAAVREAAEETGLRVAIIAPLGRVSFHFRGAEHEVEFFLAHSEAELPAWAQHLGHDAFPVPPAEVSAKLSFDNSRVVWDRARQALEGLPP